jgi:hypothetical protein
LHAIIDHFHFVITHHPSQSKPRKNKLRIDKKNTEQTQLNKERNLSKKKKDFYSFIKSISLRLLGEDIFAPFFFFFLRIVERIEKRSFYLKWFRT